MTEVNPWELDESRSMDSQLNWLNGIWKVSKMWRQGAAPSGSHRLLIHLQMGSCPYEYSVPLGVPSRPMV